MASYTANVSVHKTLTAATVDTVTLKQAASSVTEVVNRSSTDYLWVTASASGTPANPTVGGDDVMVVPPSSARVFSLPDTSGNVVVRLISATGIAYSVQAGGQ